MLIWQFLKPIYRYNFKFKWQRRGYVLYHGWEFFFLPKVETSKIHQKLVYSFEYTLFMNCKYRGDFVIKLHNLLQASSPICHWQQCSKKKQWAVVIATKELLIGIFFFCFRLCILWTQHYARPTKYVVKDDHTDTDFQMVYSPTNYFMFFLTTTAHSTSL